MKPEEVIELLKIQREDCTKSVLREDDIDYAIDALEKQIPKKPIYGEDDYRTEDNFLGKKINCGVCSENICYENSVIEYFKYCSHCGAKIDWSEEDET